MAAGELIHNLGGDGKKIRDPCWSVTDGRSRAFRSAKNPWIFIRRGEFEGGVFWLNSVPSTVPPVVRPLWGFPGDGLVADFQTETAQCHSVAPIEAGPK